MNLSRQTDRGIESTKQQLISHPSERRMIMTELTVSAENTSIQRSNIGNMYMTKFPSRRSLHVIFSVFKQIIRAAHACRGTPSSLTVTFRPHRNFQSIKESLTQFCRWKHLELGIAKEHGTYCAAVSKYLAGYQAHRTSERQDSKKISLKARQMNPTRGHASQKTTGGQDEI